MKAHRRSALFCKHMQKHNAKKENEIVRASAFVVDARKRLAVLLVVLELAFSCAVGLCGRVPKVVRSQGDGAGDESDHRAEHAVVHRACVGTAQEELRGEDAGDQRLERHQHRVNQHGDANAFGRVQKEFIRKGETRRKRLAATPSSRVGYLCSPFARACEV